MFSNLAMKSALISAAYALTSPPSGAVTVGSGRTYSTIQAAVDSGASSIFVYPGTYNEQVYITQGNTALTIYGYSSSDGSYASNQVTITHNAAASSGLTDDETGTLRAHSDNFKLYNVNVVNSYGEGSQAIALSAYGDKQGYYGVQVKGYQDTLLAESNHQIYASSYIEGATDFIFGQTALAWFENVDIGVLATSYGTITASGRDSSSNPAWYVFNNCKIAAAPGNTVAAGSYYLGRPWRDYARVVFQNTEMSSVINSAGWHDWSDSTPLTDHVVFEEYANSGDGSEGARAYETKITSAVSESTVLGSDYASWVDTNYVSRGGASEAEASCARKFRA